MSLYLWAAQQAVYTALAASADLQALIGNPARIFDQVPADTAEPYVILGEGSIEPFDTKSTAGADQEMVLEIWSGHRGAKIVKQILDAAHSALHEAALSVAGANFVLCRFSGAEIARDSDGLSTFARARFRIVTHD